MTYLTLSGAAGLWARIGVLSFGGLLATFAPCFPGLSVAPFLAGLRVNKPLSAALLAVTAAVVGVNLNLTLWFTAHGLWREVTDGPLARQLPDLALVAVSRLTLGMAKVLHGSGSWAVPCGSGLWCQSKSRATLGDCAAFCGDWCRRRDSNPRPHHYE